MKSLDLKKNSVKVTVEVPFLLWRKLKISAMDTKRDLKNVVLSALEISVKNRGAR